MNATEFCASCNEGILWKCSSCEKENDRSVHTHHPTLREELPTMAPGSVVGILISVASGMSLAAHL